MYEEEIVVILDSVNRAIMGELVAEDENKIILGNPAIINVMIGESGKTSAQIIPVYFRQVLEDVNQMIHVEYDKRSVSKTNVSKIPEPLMNEYDKLYTFIDMEMVKSEEIETEVIGD